MGKPKLGAPPGGLSRLKYSCKICDIHPRGCDIPKHYESNTNWILLAEMRKCVGDATLEDLRKKADPHSLYMFDHKYTKNHLPTWQTHAQWKEQDQEDDDEGDPGIVAPLEKKLKKMTDFFLPQVK